MLLLPEQTAKLIDDVTEVISYSQEVNTKHLNYVSQIIEDWQEAKSELSDIFLDGQLIKNFGTVTFELSQKEKDIRFNEFMEEFGSYNFSDVIDLCNFLIANGDYFYSNKTITDYNRDGYFVPAGSKIIKAFKYFIEDKDLLRELQDKASRLIQEQTITGDLCLSIHPLDFLSVSENNYAWRSCHALNGDYRSGNLSYMLDNVTMVCYLQGHEKTSLPRFPDSVPWNDKRIRMFLYFSKNKKLILAGRMYPYDIAEMRATIRKYIRTMPYYHWEAFSNWTQTINNVVSKDGATYPFGQDTMFLKDIFVPVRTIVRNKEGSQQFNDLLQSSCYKPYYMYSYDIDTNLRDWEMRNEDVYDQSIQHLFLDKECLIETGGQTPCACCGAPVMDSSDFLCLDCEEKYGTREDGFVICEHCGQRMAEGNANAVVTELGNYESWCNNCIEENNYVLCSDCGWRYTPAKLGCECLRCQARKINPAIMYRESSPEELYIDNTISSLAEIEF